MTINPHVSLRLTPPLSWGQRKDVDYVSSPLISGGGGEDILRLIPTYKGRQWWDVLRLIPTYE